MYNNERSMVNIEKKKRVENKYERKRQDKIKYNILFYI